MYNNNAHFKNLNFAFEYSLLRIPNFPRNVLAL